MLKAEGLARLAEAVEGLARGDTAGWAALAPLTRLTAEGMDVAVDFTATEALGAPLVVLRPRSGPARLPGLTPRQEAVARGLASGRTNKEIARDLGISPATAKDHVAAVLRALGLRRRAEVAALIHRAGSR